MVTVSLLSDVRHQVPSLLLSSNNWVSSFCWTRGSKLGFLTSFSYFSCYFLILGFLLSPYFLVPSCLSWLHGNQISPSCFLMPWALQGSALYMHPHVSGTGCTVSLGARLLWDPGSRLNTGLFPFSLFAKGFWCKCPLDNCRSYFSCEQGYIDPATWLDTSIEGNLTDEPSNVAIYFLLIFATALVLPRPLPSHSHMPWAHSCLAWYKPQLSPHITSWASNPQGI